MRKAVFGAAAFMLLAGPAASAGPYTGYAVGTSSILLYKGGSASFWIEVNNISSTYVCLSFGSPAVADPTYGCRLGELFLGPYASRSWGSPTYYSSLEPKLAETIAGTSIYAVLYYGYSGTASVTVGYR